MTHRLRSLAMALALAAATGCHPDSGPMQATGTRAPASSRLVATQAPLPTAVDALPPTDVAGFHELLQQMRGTPVVVNVWASWCTPCTQEAPLLAAAARRHPAVQFLGVDVQDSRGGATTFITAHGLNYPSLFDPAGSIMTDLGVTGPPVTVFYASDGRVAESVPGLLSAPTLAAGLAEIDAGAQGAKR